jgi:hypothetical protein
MAHVVERRLRLLALLRQRILVLRGRAAGTRILVSVEPIQAAAGAIGLKGFGTSGGRARRA